MTRARISRTCSHRVLGCGSGSSRIRGMGSSSRPMLMWLQPRSWRTLLLGRARWSLDVSHRSIEGASGQATAGVAHCSAVESRHGLRQSCPRGALGRREPLIAARSRACTEMVAKRRACQPAITRDQAPTVVGVPYKAVSASQPAARGPCTDVVVRQRSRQSRTPRMSLKTISFGSDGTLVDRSRMGNWHLRGCSGL